MEHIQTSVISLSLYETENHIQMHLLMFFFLFYFLFCFSDPNVSQRVKHFMKHRINATFAECEIEVCGIGDSVTWI